MVRTFLMSRDYSALTHGSDHSERQAQSFLDPQYDSTAIPLTGIRTRANRVLMSIPETREHSSDVLLKAPVISGLSFSRFRLIFTESLGLPLRQYILYLDENFSPDHGNYADRSPLA